MDLKKLFANIKNKCISKFIKISYKKRIVFIAIIFLLIMSIIKSVYIFEFKYPKKEYEKYMNFNCIVEEIEKIKDDKITYKVKYNNNNFYLTISLNEVKNESNIDICNLKYKDNIVLYGKILFSEKLNNPYEFDYKRYLNSKNIVGTIYAKKIKNVYIHKKFDFKKVIYDFKESLYEFLDENMDEKESDLYKALIFSDKLEIDENTKSLFDDNGISFMMAVSGMHIMCLLIVLENFFRKMKNKDKIKIEVLILAIYVILTKNAVSAIRACIMAVVSKVSLKKSNLLSKFKSLIFAILFIIILNPYSIFNASFIMSVFSTLGIIVLNSYIYSFFDRKKLKNDFYLYIIKNISMSISIFIFIFPIQVNYFGYFNFKSFLSTIITSNVFIYEYIIGILLIFFKFVPVINYIVINANLVTLKIILKLLTIIKCIKLPDFYLPKFNMFCIVIYYFAIFLAIYGKYIYKFFKVKYFKTIRKILKMTLISCFIFLIFNVIYVKYIENYCVFFNVKQGNMCFIRYDRKNILIDCGSTTKNLSYNVIDNFLTSKAIKNIDYVFLTHFHTDHINGIYDVIKNYKIENIFTTGVYEKTEDYYKLEQICNEYNILKRELFFGDELEFKNFKTYVLSPFKNERIKDEDVENANCLVLLLSIKDKNYLFMGDATKNTEEKVIKNVNKNLDILKKLESIRVLQVGHHGSKTSSSKEFIFCINFRVAFISSLKSVYGHPSNETIDTLKKNNIIKIHITEKNGAYIEKI